MTFTDQLLLVVRHYADANGVALKTASSRIFNESKLLDRVAEGSATITMARAEQGLVWLSENWPQSINWPSEVPRPALAPAPAEAVNP